MNEIKNRRCYYGMFMVGVMLHLSSVVSVVDYFGNSIVCR